jgi:hypothetical protein
MAADLLAANGAELTGVIVAGMVVGAFGVPWSITGLGLAVTVAASVLMTAHRREVGAPAAEPASVPVPS